jgi:hypothetical protein
LIVAAAAITLIPGAPIGLITTAVQALAGLLLPSARAFLLLLLLLVCNDRHVLGPWVNPRWGWSDLAVVVFVVVTLVLGVAVSVVEVVHMITVLDGLMTTVGAVHVRVIGRIMLAVFFGSCHFAPFYFGASLWMAMPVDWAGRT